MYSRYINLASIEDSWGINSKKIRKVFHNKMKQVGKARER